MAELRIKPVNLDQFCITQAQYDDENACEDIKKLHNIIFDISSAQINELNDNFPLYDRYLLSDECACTIMIQNVPTKVWIIKIGSMRYCVLTKEQYILNNKLLNYIAIYTESSIRSIYISGVLIGMSLDHSLNNEYVIK